MRLEKLANPDRRVVITGLGVCTPLGMTVDELLENLNNGETSVKPISGLNEIFEGCGSSVGSYLSPEQASLEGLGLRKVKAAKRRMAQNTRVSYNASREAVDDSGIFEAKDSEEIREMMGASIAAGFGGISNIENEILVALGHRGNRKGENGIGKIDEFMAVKALPGAATAFLAEDYHLHAGGFLSPACACASGAEAIRIGFRDIRDGEADAYIVGGTGDFSITSYASFDVLRALTENKNPGTASSPFDEKRNGFVFGEGAGSLVLEELEHAKARGAKIYAEVLGYGVRGDGDRPTDPRQDGKYGIQAMNQALRMARLNPSDIDYVNAHGTSTALNDPMECNVIRGAFGEYAGNIWVNSSKSMFGHMLNAAGAVEAIVTIKALYDGIIHQNRNLHTILKEGRGLRFPMHGETIEQKIDFAVSNSYAFGGRNYSLIFGKYQGD